MTLPVTGIGAVVRIISQPANGSVGLTNGTATYFPNPGFAGTDTFTFAAYDGSKNSGVGTGTVTVVQGKYGVIASAHVPPSYPASWPVPFGVVATVTNSAILPTFDWDFGDSLPHDSHQFTTHSYAGPGVYSWTVISTVGQTSTTNLGSIQIGSPMVIAATRSGDQVTVSWPNSLADSLLEMSTLPGSPLSWNVVTNTPAVAPGFISVSVLASESQFFRLRRTW
jgi:PKD repeat protein